MAGTLDKIRNYIGIKLLQPIDKKIWRFDGAAYSENLVYERSDKELIPKYYPHMRLAEIDAKNPEDKHLLEQFAAYVYKFEQPTLVEPLYGWVITGKYKVFHRSFPYITDVWDYSKRMPSTLGYVLPKKVIKIDSCLPIRYYWQSFYHFFIDTLAQVYLADVTIPADVPLLVPYFFNEIGYVREFMEASGFLKGRKIIVQQKDEYYAPKTLYLCKDAISSDSILAVAASFGQSAGDATGRKVFLKRGKKWTRSMTNEEEIEQVVAEHGFEIIDTDGMKLKEQVALFSEVELLVGLHGAALTNIIFRNGRPMRLLELFPASHRPAHYRHLCLKFGYGYDSVVGGEWNLADNKRFHMGVELFRNKLSAFTHEPVKH